MVPRFDAAAALTNAVATATIAAMEGTDALLRRLLRTQPAILHVDDDVAAWWRRFRAAEPDGMSPFDRAVLAGFRGDRVASAFAGGYQGALRALVPGRVPDETIASFCVSERGGNSPRAIEASLTPRAGEFVLNGQKRWSTMAPLASILFVAAHEGVDGAGRKRFKLVQVSATARGVTIRRMPPTTFVPEIPHAEIDLQDVGIGSEALLPGDGYTAYVRRFRTVEDLYIHGAVLGYVLGAARRFGFPPSVVERLAAAIVATRALTALDPDAPETHLALAGALARDASLLDHSDAHWDKADDAERARWRRDWQGFGSVAAALREARRGRAWERLGEVGTP